MSRNRNRSVLKSSAPVIFAIAIAWVAAPPALAQEGNADTWKFPVYLDEKTGVALMRLSDLRALVAEYNAKADRIEQLEARLKLCRDSRVFPHRIQVQGGTQ